MVAESRLINTALGLLKDGLPVGRRPVHQACQHAVYACQCVTCPCVPPRGPVLASVQELTHGPRVCPWVLARVQALLSAKLSFALRPTQPPFQARPCLGNRKLRPSGFRGSPRADIQAETGVSAPGALSIPLGLYLPLSELTQPLRSLPGLRPTEVQSKALQVPAMSPPSWAALEVLASGRK